MDPAKERCGVQEVPADASACWFEAAVAGEARHGSRISTGAQACEEGAEQ